MVATILWSVMILAPVASFAAVADPGLQVNTEQGVPVRGDFQVGPTRFNLTLAPGEQQTVTVQVLNREGRAGAFRLSIEDFSGGESPLEPTQLYGSEAGPFTAKAWVRPAVQALNLDHGQRGFIRVVVQVPRDAEPGDHYAAVLVERVPEDGGSAFSVVSRVGSLFLITVKGEVVQNGNITDLQVLRSVYWGYPIVTRLSAMNEGNVHLIPEGSVIIRNMFGLPVAEIPVERWIVLRGSRRSLDLPWHPGFALGRYTVSANLRVFGDPAPELKTSFWVIPALPILSLLFAVFIFSFCVQYFFTRFEVRRRKRR
jgi:hypothetical protein